MRRRITYICALCALGMLLLNLSFSIPQARAQGYEVVLQDEAGLLSVDQINALAGKMKALTKYGNVGFFTLNSSGYASTAELAEQLYGRYMRGRGRDLAPSGTLFLIDMSHRQIYIYSEGAFYKTITRSYAYTITDNVYRYARDGRYYECAYQAFEQEKTLLEGQRISQPMKLVGNIFLALALSMFINWLLVWRFSRTKAPTEEELVSGIFEKQRLIHINRQFVRVDRVYNPKSSGGGHSGGHRGGGHHSGGGGGHSF